VRTNRNLDAADMNEAIVDRCLRDPPPRTAPATLEARVIAACRRRAARPWWRREIAHWPGVARAAIVAACAASAVPAWRASSWLLAGIGGLVGQGGAVASWTRAAAGGVAALRATLLLTSVDVPPLWACAGLLIAGGLYAALLGLGAIAYRALYLEV
jgi:hypothetical protein